MSKGNYLKKNNLIVSTIHVEKSSHYIRTQFGHIRTHFVKCTDIGIVSNDNFHYNDTKHWGVLDTKLMAIWDNKCKTTFIHQKLTLFFSAGLSSQFQYTDTHSIPITASSSQGKMF